MRRFSVVNNGYNIDEVNNFIDVVIKRMEDLNRTNISYMNQINDYKKKIDEMSKMSFVNNREPSNFSDKIKEQAKNEADLIIKEARENANVIIHEALISAAKKEQELEQLKINYKVYRSKFKNLIDAQYKFLEEEEIDK